MPFYNALKPLFLSIIVLLFAQSASAQGFHMVGSSTVYPYAEAVINELTKDNRIQKPTVKVTGTGSGFKIFCLNSGEKAPDITNASARITKEQLQQCVDHNVSVLEILIGYDTIIIAESSRKQSMKLSSKALFLALAAKVPNPQGTALITNPYHYWDEIDNQLPHRKITIYGPPMGSGTYDTLKTKLLKRVSRKIKAYQGDYFTKVRQDGVYIDDHENHEADIPKLMKNKDSIAIFGRGTYAIHTDKISALTLDGIEASPENAANLSYPLSRPLYFYIRLNSTADAQRKADAMTYANTMVSDIAVGEDGICTKKGLVPLSPSLRKVYKLWLQYGRPITPFMLK